MKEKQPGKNSYALVTGGSSGMGLEYVKKLCAKGYNVIIAALFQNEVDQVKQELGKLYPQNDILAVGIDLSQENSAKNLFDIVKEKRPDANVEVLINNAGVLYPRHFRNMTQEQVGRIIMLHNYTLSMLCHYFLPQMLENRRGYILNISSMAATFPFPFISLYSATKAFTKVFTRALRTELRGSGVVASSIYFGAVSTNLYNLSPALRRLAIGLGVMMPAERAARIALKMLFRGRSGKTPGFLNKLFVPLAGILPHTLVAWIDKKVTNRWKLL